MSRFQLGALLVGGLVLGGIAGWFRPLPKPSTTPQADTASWELPPKESLERSSIEMVAKARNLKWPGEAGGPGGSTSLEDWALKAILGADDEILIATGKDAVISRARVGDTLPDGSRLVALRGDTAVVEIDGCRSDRHLYARAADSGPTECRTASLPKETQ